jgi:hypothetical protein
MKTIKEIKEKEFDTVKTFRAIKEKISLDIADMTLEQIKEYLKNQKLDDNSSLANRILPKK